MSARGSTPSASASGIQSGTSASNAVNIATFTSSIAHNDQDREDLLELCELAGVTMSRDLLNTIHSLLASPLHVSPTALFHVLKEATAASVTPADQVSAGVDSDTNGSGAVPSTMVEINGTLAKRKPQTPR